MKLFVDIESDNEAMDTYGTIKCLQTIIHELNEQETFGVIRDTNGNTVGRWEYDPS